MKITKLGHSCVLVETDDRVALFDPGKWATNFDLDAIDRIDRIVVTHEHPDHLDTDKVKAIIDKFPDAHIVSNPEIAAICQEAGISATYRDETECTEKFSAPHEKLPVPGVAAPAENGYHFKGLYSQPGDSHSFDETKKVLALAFVSPWGSVTDAVNLAIKLQPEYVLSVHDWFYTQEAREWLHGLLTAAFEDTDIQLLDATPGVTHEIAE